LLGIYSSSFAIVVATCPSIDFLNSKGSVSTTRFPGEFKTVAPHIGSMTFQIRDLTDRSQGIIFTSWRELHLINGHIICNYSGVSRASGQDLLHGVDLVSDLSGWAPTTTNAPWDPVRAYCGRRSSHGGTIDTCKICIYCNKK
jgi:hypothetical protein